MAVVADDGGDVRAAFGGEADRVIWPARQADNADRLLAGMRQRLQVIQPGFDVEFGFGGVRRGPAFDKAPVLPVGRDHEKTLSGEFAHVGAIVAFVAALGMDEQHWREGTLACGFGDLDRHFGAVGSLDRGLAQFDGVGEDWRAQRQCQEGTRQGAYFHDLLQK